MELVRNGSILLLYHVGRGEIKGGSGLGERRLIIGKRVILAFVGHYKAVVSDDQPSHP